MGTPKQSTRRTRNGSSTCSQNHCAMPWCTSTSFKHHLNPHSQHHRAMPSMRTFVLPTLSEGSAGLMEVKATTRFVWRSLEIGAVVCYSHQHVQLTELSPNHAWKFSRQAIFFSFCRLIFFLHLSMVSWSARFRFHHPDLNIPNFFLLF